MNPEYKNLGLCIELRGQQVTITDIDIGAADRSVGIMSEYVEGYVLQDAAGNELDWYDSLTKEEKDAIDNAIYEKMREADDKYAALLEDEGFDDMGTY